MEFHDFQGAVIAHNIPAGQRAERIGTDFYGEHGAVFQLKHYLEVVVYFLVHFKNIPFVLIASVYLLVRLLKSNIAAKAGIVAGFSLTLIASVVFYFVYGWTMVSLFCVTNVLFLSLMCLGCDETSNLIKSNFIRHKYIFSAVIICMLM